MRRLLLIPCFGLLVLVLILLSSGSGRLFIANVPQYWFSGVIERDVPFAPDLGLALDIYRPPGAVSGTIVVFFHGGSWQTGARQDYRFVGMTLAQMGHTVVIPDYRKYPDVRFPAFVEDGAAAVAWAQARLSPDGGGRKVVLMGHSAGAHIAAMLTADARYMDGAGGRAPDALIGLAGPYHFNPDTAVLQEIFGPPEAYPRMQVTTFVDGGEPPMALLWGEDDTTVGLFNITRLTPALRESGVCHSVATYPGVDHISVIAAFAWPFRANSPVVRDVGGFLANPGSMPCGGQDSRRSS